MATRRNIIAGSMKENGETWADVVAENVAVSDYQPDGSTPSLDAEFDSGYGGPEGCRFLVWTSRFVYFPCCYDGSEWADCAPLAPSAGLTQAHIGGF